MTWHLNCDDLGSWLWFISQVTEVPDPTVAEEQALLAMQQEQLEREAEEAEMEDDEEDDD